MTDEMKNNEMTTRVIVELAAPPKEDWETLVEIKPENGIVPTRPSTLDPWIIVKRDRLSRKIKVQIHGCSDGLMATNQNGYARTVTDGKFNWGRSIFTKTGNAFERNIEVEFFSSLVRSLDLIV